jgi:hypothetical protein
MSWLRRLTLVGLAFVAVGCGSGRGTTGEKDSGVGMGGAGSGKGGGAGAAASGGAEGGGGIGGAVNVDGGGGMGGAVNADGGGGIAGGGGGAGGAAGGVVIIRGDPARKFATATFEARGWGAEHEGRLVVVRVGIPSRPPERLASGQARFHDGGFSLALPMGVETSLYKAKYAFVDVDGDGACTPANDIVYQDFSFLDNDLTFVLDGSVPAAVGTSERGMPRISGPDMAGPICDILNGPWPAS